jgi:hypothetical protein
MTCIGGERKVPQGFGGKARRKETTRKTEVWIENGVGLDLGENGC